MKRVISHTKQCKRKTNGGCPICKQLIALCCYHAKLCQVRDLGFNIIDPNCGPEFPMTLRCDTDLALTATIVPALLAALHPNS